MINKNKIINYTMLSKMSKSDKTMFYYLGLSLLLLIVLGVVFGVSSVKESYFSFDGAEYCLAKGVKEMQADWKMKKLWKNESELRSFVRGELESKCQSQSDVPFAKKASVESWGKKIARRAREEWMKNQKRVDKNLDRSNLL
tara:strand:+ start:4105 stop:4530 length:426 start_codon:yes stop_codon:yes gene_type:complete